MRRSKGSVLISPWLCGLAFLTLLLTLAAMGQQASTAPPPLIQLSSVATDQGGNSLSGVVNITFSLYNGQQGGESLWTETQNNVQLDSTGHYSVQLGITKRNGVPTTLFTTGEARWLGMQIAEQAEQPRVLLLSVPYALKAGDAATIGGLPPSAFVLAPPPTAADGSPASATTGSTAASADAPPAGGVTGTGTADFIPVWTSTSNIGNSVLFQSGTGKKAKVGINTITPASALDVKGTATVRGLFSLPASGTANASSGFNSQPLGLTASAFNSGTGTAVTQNFQWQAEPVGNDSGTASGSLNLLFGQGSNKVAETGLKIASNGQITFATGQAFPGTGDGTVTSVGSGAGLTGGPITGSGSLSIATGGVTNTMLANPSLTVNAGTDLTGGGLVALGSATTLNLDTSKVPQLSTANTFTGNQTVNGNLSATGVVSGGSYQIGGNLFAFGSYANQNAFLGFAGNTTITGTGNTGSGVAALYSNTSGTYNTATGGKALYSNTIGTYNTANGFGALIANTSGTYNTASGLAALYENTTGYFNTASGASALFSNATGTYNTASGSQALYENTTGGQNTASGYNALYSNTTGSYLTASGFQALYSNTTGADNAASGSYALESNTTGYYNVASGDYALYSNTTGAENTAVGLEALIDNTTGNDLTCVGFDCGVAAPNLRNATAIGAHATVSVSNALVLGSVAGVNGATGTINVGIGTSAPSNILTIGRGLGHPVSDSWETYSSRRWKTHIQPLHNALGMIEQLRGVSYDRKDSGKHEIGVIAEEVGAVVPEVVSYEENGKDARGVDYSRLTALLIEATKEQQLEIQHQRAVLRAQAAAIRDLKSELRATRQALQKVQARVTAAQPTLVAAR
jgi:hypothetical protein